MIHCEKIQGVLCHDVERQGLDFAFIVWNIDELRYHAKRKWVRSVAQPPRLGRCHIRDYISLSHVVPSHSHHHHNNHDPQTNNHRNETQRK